MLDTLPRELATLRHGDHLCLPYEDHDDRDQVIAPFIADGLARGERCVYILEPDQHDTLMKMLAAAGVNAGRARDRGALLLRTPQDIYFRSGKFDPDDTLALADELIASALADGFAGVRASGETAAPEVYGVTWQTVFSYEVRCNERFAGRPITALCRYRRPGTPAARMADALRTHPTAIVGGRVCRNPYYEKPDIAMAEDSDAARVEWMLCRLRRAAATDLRSRDITRSLAGETARLSAENQSHAHTEEELERAVRVRDRFLDVLAEELSGPVGGLAAEIHALAQSSSAGESRASDAARDRPTRLSALGQHLARLSAVVEELKEVSRLTNRAAAVWDDVDLADVARQVTLRSRDRLATVGSSVAFRSEPRIQGRWDRRRVEQLIANLLINAGKRGAGHPIDLDLTTDGGTAIVSVRYRSDAHLRDQRTEDSRPNIRVHQPAASNDSRGLWVSREIASSFGGTLHVAPGVPGRHDDPGLGKGDHDGHHGAAHAVANTVITVELPRNGPRARARATS